jgi:hypothetical protein
MSSNKQSMKVYTEESLKEFLTTKQSFITLDDMLNLESIELPSDMEIYEEATSFHSLESNIDTFTRGARFIKEKIINKA